MTAPALRGARAKFERAQQQFDELERDVGRVLYPDDPLLCPYDFPVELNFYGVEWVEYPRQLLDRMNSLGEARELSPGRWYFPTTREARYKVSLEFTQRLPLLEWGVRIGEILHDLRSVLDCITWELTILHQRRIGVSPRKNPELRWRTVQWPVSDRLVKPAQMARGIRYWPDQAKNCLWGIDKSVHALFELLQPHTLKGKSRQHPLWILDALWNTDKHRTVNVVVGYANLREVSLSSGDNDPSSAAILQQLTLETFSVPGARPLKGRTEIAQVIIHCPGSVDFQIEFRRVPVQVNPKALFQPRFAKSGPGQGLPIRVALGAMIDLVGRILNRFEAEFP